MLEEEEAEAGEEDLEEGVEAAVEGKLEPLTTSEDQNARAAVRK